MKGFINDQEASDIAELKFGAWGNVGDNGCGAIAVYNANLLLGTYEPLEEVLKDFNTSNSPATLPMVNTPTLVGGKMGGNPLYIQQYYEERGYSTKWHLDLADIPKDADAYITLTIYEGEVLGLTLPAGGHYQAGIYEAGRLHVYNGEANYTDFKDMYNSGSSNIFMGVLEIQKRK